VTKTRVTVVVPLDQPEGWTEFWTEHSASRKRRPRPDESGGGAEPPSVPPPSPGPRIPPGARDEPRPHGVSGDRFLRALRDEMLTGRSSRHLDPSIGADTWRPVR
jgi:hypothetical protein